MIVEEFNSASPVTMIVRATRPMGAFAFGNYSNDGFTHFRIIVLNNSGQAWVEFEFELQESLGRASLFGDGLSFDQRGAETNGVTSDNFALNRRDFEPYDRLRFVDGKVDPLKAGRFSFLVTDFTPRATYYLLQDPRIPFS